MAGGVYVLFGERDASAVGSNGPVSGDPVSHPVHEAVVPVEEFEPLAVVGQPARKWAEHIGHPGVVHQVHRRRGDDEITAAGNDRALGKPEINAPGQHPPRQVHIHRHLVMEFDPFHGRFIGCRVVHDLVEDHDTIGADRCNRESQQQGQGKGFGPEESHHANYIPPFYVSNLLVIVTVKRTGTTACRHEKRPASAEGRRRA